MTPEAEDDSHEDDDAGQVEFGSFLEVGHSESSLVLISGNFHTELQDSTRYIYQNENNER